MFTIFENALSTLNSIVWGPGMLILLVGTGLYLTLRLRFLSLRSIPSGRDAPSSIQWRANFPPSMR